MVIVSLEKIIKRFEMTVLFSFLSLKIPFYDILSFPSLLMTSFHFQPIKITSVKKALLKNEWLLVRRTTVGYFIDSVKCSQNLGSSCVDSLMPSKEFAFRVVA